MSGLEQRKALDICLNHDQSTNFPQYHPDSGKASKQLKMRNFIEEYFVLGDGSLFGR
jgi:hypothetical protein